MNLPFALSLAVLAALSVLTFRGLRKKADRARQEKINKILALTGAALFAVSVVWGFSVCLLAPRTEESVRWAGDMTFGYLLLVGPLFLVVIVPLLLRTLLDRGRKRDVGKRRAVRILLSLAGSAACLLLSALWSSVTAGGVPDLSPVYLSAGVSLALILRLTLIPEYRS